MALLACGGGRRRQGIAQAHFVAGEESVDPRNRFTEKDLHICRAVVRNEVRRPRGWPEAGMLSPQGGPNGSRRKPATLDIDKLTEQRPGEVLAEVGPRRGEEHLRPVLRRRRRGRDG